jgi:hypothetical protein
MCFGTTSIRRFRVAENLPIVKAKQRRRRRLWLITLLLVDHE